LRFLPAALGLETFAVAWSWFLAIELLPLVAALGAAVWLARRGYPGANRFGTRLLASATVVLVAVPLVAYGYYNDWAMRVSIPALFAIQVVAARALSRVAVPAWARCSLAALLLVAGLYPLAQLYSQAAAMIDRREWIALAPQNQVEDLFEVQRTRAPFFGFLEQYVVSTNAPFFRYLAPPLEPRSIGATAGGGPQGPPSDSLGTTRSN
jgi:hypothetical protein